MISIYNPSEVKSTTLPRNITDAIQQGGGGGSVINDETIGTNTTWSSNKINTEIGSISVDVIDDTVTSTEKTWSSDKIDDVVSEKAAINDNTTGATTTWSSNKINSEIGSISVDVIDDTVTSTTKTWSSDKIDDVVSDKATINDSATGTTTTWSSNKIRSEIDSGGSETSGFKLTFLDAPNLSKLLNTATYTSTNYQIDTQFTAFSIPSFRIVANNHVLLAFDIHTIAANNGVTSIDIEIQLSPNTVNRLNFTVSKESDANMFAVPLYSFGIVNESATFTGEVRYTVHSNSSTPAEIRTAFTLYNIS